VREGGVLLADLRHHPLVDRVEERVLAGHPGVDRTDGDPRAPADLAECEALVALLVEQIRGRLEHALERCPAALLLRRTDLDPQLDHPPHILRGKELTRRGAPTATSPRTELAGSLWAAGTFG